MNNVRSFSLPYSLTNPADTINSYRSHLYVVGSQKSCITVQAPHRDYRMSFTLYPDSLLNIPLPYNLSHRLEKTLNWGIFLESTAPVQVIYADHTDTLMQIQTLSKIPPALPSTVDKFDLLSVHATAINPNTRVKYSGKIYGYGVKDPVYLNDVFPKNNNRKDNRTTTWIVNNLHHPNQYDWYWMHGTDRYVNNTASPPATSKQVSIKPDSTYYVDLENIQFFVRRIDTSFLKTKNPVKSYQSSPANISSVIEVEYVGFANEELALPYAYDTAFHFGKLAGYEGYVASLQATEDSTRLVINNQKVKYLDKLEGLDTAVSTPLTVRSSAPLVGYLANDATDTAGYPRFNNNYISFFSIAANGDNHLMTESLFATLGKTDGNYHYQVALVCRSRDTGQLTLDGNALPPGSFKPFPTDSLWSYANVEVSRGVHRVACPGGFHGFTYNYYLHPQRRSDLLYSNYGYNLAQNITWPEDSFHYRVGTAPGQLQPFSDFQPPELCPGDSLYFSPSQRRNKTWLWDMGDGTVIRQKNGENAPPTLPYAWQQGGTYTVVLRDSAGCAPPDSLTISIEPGAVANFSAEIETRCEGFQINLYAQTSGPWQWKLPGGVSSDSTVSFNYVGTERELPITLIAGEDNCADTLRENINLPEGSIPEPVLPNIFTPNGDGINDAFCIPGAEGFAGCFSLQVYNRYGRALFTTSDPTQCWEPPRRTPQGVYFYLLRIGEKEYRGALHLQR